MKALRIALLGLATATTLFVQAQTADEIINKHIDAIGGDDLHGSTGVLQLEVG